MFGFLKSFMLAAANIIIFNKNTIVSAAAVSQMG